MLFRSIKRPENTELLMIRLLSYFVINKQTPHIVLPMTTFNTSIKPFLNLTKSNIVNNKKFWMNIFETTDFAKYIEKTYKVTTGSIMEDSDDKTN